MRCCISASEYRALGRGRPEASRGSSCGSSFAGHFWAAVAGVRVWFFIDDHALPIEHVVAAVLVIRRQRFAVVDLAVFIHPAVDFRGAGRGRPQRGGEQNGSAIEAEIVVLSLASITFPVVLNGLYIDSVPAAARRGGGSDRPVRRSRCRACRIRVLTSCAAECAPLPRSWRSSAIAMPAGSAPAARMVPIDSRTEVPAEMTSSMISTLPARGAPTIVPPSPWSFASLRLKANGTLRRWCGVQCDGGRGGQRDALVGRPEQHVERRRPSAGSHRHNIRRGPPTRRHRRIRRR